MHVIAHIGKSIQIKGEVTAQEPLTIAGQVIGTIDVSGHPLTVTETATIEADGWLAGAQAHEQRPLVGFDPLTFVGIVQLMPGSAD